MGSNVCSVDLLRRKLLAKLGTLDSPLHLRDG